MALEVLNLGKQLRHKEDPETGLPLEREPLEWTEITETRATGKDVEALKGQMREAGLVGMQQAHNRRQKYGVETLSTPNGQPLEVPAPLIDTYRQRGFGQAALKTSFRVDGFGGMKALGLRRITIRYHNGAREITREER